jgi:hypothetical protein
MVPQNWGRAVILRFMNFCVLAALGMFCLSGGAGLNHSIQARLPGYVPPPSASILVSQDVFSDRLVAKLADMKAEIHAAVCRRGRFILFRAGECGPERDS